MTNAIVEILELINEVNAHKKTKLQLDYGFFKTYLPYFTNKVELLKTAYINEETFNPNIDYNFEEFYQILKLDKSFLLEYVKFVFDNYNIVSTREFAGISIIWGIDNIETELRAVFDLIVEKGKYFVDEEFTRAFFSKLDTKNTKRSVTFLKQYLANNITNRRAVELVFECARHSLKEYHDELLLFFLDKNENLDDFINIDWIDSFFVGNGDVIWEDVRAGQLQKILDVFDRITRKKYRFNQHKEYLRNAILAEKRQADLERKLNFQKRNW